MEVIYDKPPIYDKVAAAFNIKDDSTVIFTYGNKLFVPGGRRLVLDKPLMRHEETHARQQKITGIEEWWERFLVDPAFRLSQELEAYREQYRAMASLPLGTVVGYLEHICADLSGEMYGNMLTADEAKAVITEGIVLKRPKVGGANNARKSNKLKRQNKKRGRR